MYISISISIIEVKGLVQYFLWDSMNKVLSIPLTTFTLNSSNNLFNLLLLIFIIRHLLLHKKLLWSSPSF